MRKKFLAFAVLSSITLSADVNVLTYAGETFYDKSRVNSLKDNSFSFGIYAEIKEKGSAWELLFNNTTVAYKSNTLLKDFTQQDFVANYSKFYDSSKIKLGVHYVNNNESSLYKDLGSAYIGILGLEAQSNFNNNTLHYGIEAYYSVYLNAHTEFTRASTAFIDVTQFSPYLTHITRLSSTLSNTLSLRLNAIAVTEYRDPGYLSFEVVDTMKYQSFYGSVKFLAGEMKSGVMNGGLEVYNTKDLVKGIYYFEAGYVVTPELRCSASFDIRMMQEYRGDTLTYMPEVMNNSLFFSLNYTIK